MWKIHILAQECEKLITRREEESPNPSSKDQMQKQEEEEEEEEGECGEGSSSPALNFVSPQFDALKALEAEDLQPPDAAAEPLSNLEACRSILPEESYSLLDGVVKEDSANKDIGRAIEIVTMQEEDSGRNWDSLNFFSPEFNALEALYAKDLTPPNARVRPLDNLTRCRRILPQEIPESMANVPQRPPRSLESISAQERAKAHKSLLMEKAAERARQVKIFDLIAEKLQHGPLGLLADCYTKQIRVKVWTRHSHGVRGSLTGVLTAFDKHLNMVLCDIVEEYSVRRWVPRLVRRRGKLRAAHEADNIEPEYSSSLSKDTCSIDQAVEEITTELKELRLFPKLEHRRRHLNQVFLRGDSVVMVQKLARA